MPFPTYEQCAAAAEKVWRFEHELECALQCRANDDHRGYWKHIRAIHTLNADAIAAHKYNPGIVNWMMIFSPIEELAWYTIRASGMTMFPQYPIGKYFADFADPWSKWALECDGKAYHDSARDGARDQDMWAMGWTVSRIPGRLFMLDDENEEGAHQRIRQYAFEADPVRYKNFRPAEKVSA